MSKLKNIQKLIAVCFLIILIMTGVSLQLSQVVKAGDIFEPSGLVYYYDNGKKVGTPTDPPSLATAKAYRLNVPTNIAVSNVPDDNKIFPSEGSDSALFLWDVGSSDWVPAPIAGDTAIVVLETYSGLNGWTGDAYVAGVRQIITTSDLNNNGMAFNNDAVLEKIPIPVMQSSSTNSITIRWTGLWDNSTGASGGLANNTVLGYAIYRNIDGGAYSLISTTSQNAGGTITYTDNSVNPGNTYRYKLKVRFNWTSNSPNYYESTAEGTPSAAMSTAIPEPDRLAFLTTTKTTQAGTKTTYITIETRDSSGNGRAVISDTTISLTSNSSGVNARFYEVLAGNCTANIINTVTITTGNTLGQFCYYDEKTSSPTWNINVSKTSPASPTWIGAVQAVTITPAALESFQFNINSPQNNRIAFSGVNTLTALDMYSNVKTDFNASTNNVTISVTPNGDVFGLAAAGNDKLTLGSDFVNGVANLTTKLAYAGLAGSKTFTAQSADAKTGTSGSIQINGGNIDHFAFTLESTQINDTAFTGTNTLTALDADNNIITGFNASINNVTITESAGSGNVSGLNSNNVLNQAGDFVNGVANLTNRMKYLGPVGSHQFRAVSGSANSLSNSIMIQVGPLAQFLVNIPSPQINDTYFSGGSATAQDGWGNTITNFDSAVNPVTVSASGTGTVSISSRQSAILDTAGDFVNGVAPLSGIVKFTGLSGSHTFTFTSQNGKLGTSSSVVINPGILNNVKITDRSGPSPTEVNNFNMDVDTPVVLWASGYDVSGNFISNVIGNWTSNNLVPSVSNNNVNYISLSPTEITSNGMVTFNDASSHTDSTGTITVNAGSAATFEVAIPSTAQAGVDFSMISITAKDQFGNIATNYTGAKTLSYAGPNDGFDLGIPIYTTNVNFTNGVSTTNLITRLVRAETVKISVSQGSISGQSNEITVSPAEANHLHVFVSGSVTAGQEFDLGEIIANDQYGNLATSYSGSKNLTYSGPEPSPRGDNPSYTTSVAFNSGRSIGPIPTMLYKAQTVRILFNDGVINGESNDISIGAAAGETILYVSGNNQSGVVANPLPQPIIVMIKDIYENPKSNFPVDFIITSGDGNVTNQTALSNPNGHAENIWILGPSVGDDNNVLEARAVGLNGNPVTFTASALPAVATKLKVNAQSYVIAGDEFSITISATDSLGNIVNSYEGTKNISYSGPSNALSGAAPVYTLTLDFENGVTGFVPTTLFKAETTKLTAVINSDSLTGESDDITVQASTPDHFEIIAPSNVAVGVSFNLTSITIYDEYGNKATNYNGSKVLSYSGPGNSPDGSLPMYTNSVTFINGASTSTVALTLVKAEIVVLNASDGNINGSSNQISVSYQNPFILYYISGNNQTGIAGHELAQPLIVAVFDQNGNPATTKVVNFVSSSGNLSSTTVNVGQNGQAQVSYTLGTVAGNSTVTASVDGISSTIIFNSTVIADSAYKLSLVSISQQVRVNSSSEQITVCIQDQFGNPVQTVADRSISLSSTSNTGNFATNSTGPWTTIAINLPIGQTCTSFYYKDPTAGTYNINVVSDGLNPDTKPIQVIPNDIVRIEISPSEFSIYSDETLQLHATAYNQDDLVETNVNIVWSMADSNRGAINQNGVYYPAATEGRFVNAIKANVGNIVAYATPNISIREDSTPSSSSSSSQSSVITIVKEVPFYIPTTNGSSSSDKYTYTIIINKYYSSDNQEEGEVEVDVTKPNFPIILSPTQSLNVYKDAGLFVSGTAQPGQLIIVKTNDGENLGTAKSDDNGFWKAYISEDRLKIGLVTLIAEIYNTNIQSLPVKFSVKGETLFGRLF